MRAILSKAVAVSMIAGAGLLVSACGGGETTTTVNNTTTVEVPVDNVSVSDDMTGGIDGATGNGMLDSNATIVTNTTDTTVTTDTTTVGNAM